MKPNTITTVAHNGAPLFQYQGQIDFNMVADWQVMTFMPDTMTFEFAKKSAHVKLSTSFEVRTQPLESNDRTLAVTFVPHIMSRVKDQDARRSLLRFLTVLKLPIIWKEGKHGYDINKSGYINHSWKLDSVYRTSHS